MAQKNAKKTQNAKKSRSKATPEPAAKLSRKEYEKEMLHLQTEL